MMPELTALLASSQLVGGKLIKPALMSVDNRMLSPGCASSELRGDDWACNMPSVIFKYYN
jgi:hypothetical protein